MKMSRVTAPQKMNFEIKSLMPAVLLRKFVKI